MMGNMAELSLSSGYRLGLTDRWIFLGAPCVH